MIGARCFKGIVLTLFQITLLLVLSGCVTPRATTVEDTASLAKYKKVYTFVAETNSDPQNVYPRIVNGLRRCGFEVIEVSADSPTEGQGSGFIITPGGLAVTCAHVIKGNTVATAWINGSRYPAKVLSYNTNSDIALLQVENTSNVFKPFFLNTDTNYFLGQEVYSMGFPLVEILGKAPRLNKGMVSSTVGFEDNPDQLQVSAAVQPGNSGGPLLNPNGEVVGMVSATLSPTSVFVRSGGALPQNVNFAVKNGPIIEFLRTNQVQVAITTNLTVNNFESARDSLVLVRAGNVTEEDLKASAMICVVRYISMWDMGDRFRLFHMEFLDIKTGKSILKVGQYAENPFASVDGTLNAAFREVYSKFFPNSPNPFNSPKSASPPQKK